MARVGEGDTAYAGRDAGFLVTPEASWTDPAQTDEAIAWGRATWDALGRALDRRHVPQLPRPRRGARGARRAAGYGANYERLAELKAKYDPDNLFRMNIEHRACCVTKAGVRAAARAAPHA